MKIDKRQISIPVDFISREPDCWVGIPTSSLSLPPARLCHQLIPAMVLLTEIKWPATTTKTNNDCLTNSVTSQIRAYRRAVALSVLIPPPLLVLGTPRPPAPHHSQPATPASPASRVPSVAPRILPNARDPRPATHLLASASVRASVDRSNPTTARSSAKAFFFLFSFFSFYRIPAISSHLDSRTHDQFSTKPHHPTARYYHRHHHYHHHHHHHHHLHHTASPHHPQPPCS